MLRDLFTWFKRAGWAPALVLLVHGLPDPLNLRSDTNWLIHYLGGVAIAFFFFRGIRIFKRWFGEITFFATLLLTFSLSCTTALFWEFVEYASDVFLKTRIQHSIVETMGDLLAGAGGAASVCTLVVFFCRGR